MRTASRTTALLAVLATALACPACARLSNNKGKIEGTWKLTSCTSIPDSANAALKSGQGSIYFEFAPDGKATMRVEVPGLVSESVSGSYALLVEDFVQFSDFPAQKQKSGGFLGPVRSKENVRVTVNGDEMSLMTSDDTLHFTRVK